MKQPSEGVVKGRGGKSFQGSTTSQNCLQFVLGDAWIRFQKCYQMLHFTRLHGSPIQVQVFCRFSFIRRPGRSLLNFDADCYGPKRQSFWSLLITIIDFFCFVKSLISGTVLLCMPPSRFLPIVGKETLKTLTLILLLISNDSLELTTLSISSRISSALKFATNENGI